MSIESNIRRTAVLSLRLQGAIERAAAAAGFDPNNERDRLQTLTAATHALITIGSVYAEVGSRDPEHRHHEIEPGTEMCPYEMDMHVAASAHVQQFIADNGDDPEVSQAFTDECLKSISLNAARAANATTH